MGASLVFLVITAALVWLWLDGARAREIAVHIAQAMCNKRGFQLLDGSVHLQRTGLRWGSNGLRIRRMFDFDFSTEGTGRRSGYLILIGTDIEQADLGLPRQTGTLDQEQEQAKPESKPKSNVVQIHRPKKK